MKFDDLRDIVTNLDSITVFDTGLLIEVILDELHAVEA